jgi:hypothetical protein
METWTITLTLDIEPLDEAGLHELVRALPPGSTAGRSPYGPQLRPIVHLVAATADDAITAARVLVRTALCDVLQLVGDIGPIVAIEVLTGDEVDRRLAVADARHDSGLPPMYSTKQAAELLGVTPGAIRQRAEGGSIPTRKVGDAGWVFPAAAIDALAAAKRRGEDI